MTAFLANENISRTAVDLLRESGHDVRWVSESLPSIRDELVLHLAAAEGRIIITFDSDYGELIFHKKLPAPTGVIYLRLDTDDPALPAQLILKYISVSPDFFVGRFSVLTDRGIRYRML